jgi:hypothetical protein
MPIIVDCRECGRKLRVPDSAAWQQKKCPNCGSPIRIEAPSSPSDLPETTPPVASVPTAQPTTTPYQAWRDSRPPRVVVVDFDMPFASIMLFMIKWVIASIPAAFLVLCLGYLSLWLMAHADK